MTRGSHDRRDLLLRVLHARAGSTIPIHSKRDDLSVASVSMVGRTPTPFKPRVMARYEAHLDGETLMFNHKVRGREINGEKGN
jgi:hypothetical protein